MINVVLYSKPNCKYCTYAKGLLQSKGEFYTEVVLEKDILIEDFKSQYPMCKSMPLICIDGVEIGGYDQLVEYYNSKPTLLTETE